MRKWMNNNWKKIGCIVGLVVFMSIILKVFCDTTYIFRNTGADRTHLIGIENEKLDMVYVGGSAAFVYWQPLKAWNDCGFTSYNYATNTLPAESIKAYVAEARKTQNPKLFVIDARPFQYYSEEHKEGGFRNGTDGMDLTSVNRYLLIRDYFKHRNMPEDTDYLSYFLDIAKYHSNTEALGSEAAWMHKENNNICPNKGWEWMDEYAYLDEPTDFYTSERAQLSENALEILQELLEYCQEEELNVLFVVCPYYLTREEQAIYNTIGDTVKSYGFDYLNANEHYNDIGIDFSSDYYNKNHVNLFGAKKYTDFLENYIVQNYDMPDHREDPAYVSWNEDFQRFSQEEAIHSGTVLGKMEYVKHSSDILLQMKETQSLSEWAELATGYRYSLLIACTDGGVWPQNLADQNVLTRWGLKPDGGRSMRVVVNNQIKYSNESAGELVVDGSLFNEWDNATYHMSVESETPSIQIDGEEMEMDQVGINIIVYENNYRKVVGNVTVRCGEDGRMTVNDKKCNSQ